MHDQKTIERLKAEYPVGTRICLDLMRNDPRPIKPGTLGEVIAVDDIGTIHCKFEDGRQLGLVYPVDAFHVITSKITCAADKYPMLIGRSISGNKRLHNLNQVADFIIRHGMDGDVELKTECGVKILDTCGIYVKSSINEEYRDELIKVLKPLQDELAARLAAEAKASEIEALPKKPLRFICPLEIRAEPQIYETDWDESYDDGYEEISASSATGCEDEINNAIWNYAEECEANRGLMAYYSDNFTVNERFYSAFPKVEVIGGELMGIFDCQTCGEPTEAEIEEIRDYLSGQASDGWGEGFEQHGIKTGSLGEIFVSFWSNVDEWSMWTEEEFLSGQNETEDMGMTI